MAQQEIRRGRRAAGRKTAFWRGLLLSIAYTAAAVVLFALLISFTDLSDGAIRIVNQLIKASAVFLGVRSIVPRGDESGIRRGALLGLVYMGVGVIVYALLTRQTLTPWGYLMDVLMGVAVGGLSGMLFGSLRPKGR